MAEPGGGQGRLSPTLFDKLIAGNDIGGMRGSELDDVEQRRDSLRFFSVPQIERFNEAALRATVRRELSWLFNTTNLDSAIDLDPYPHVKTSVLNYGVPDLAGQTLSQRTILRRSRDLRTAIHAFEPRMELDSVEVEVAQTVERENAVTFIIRGDVRNAVRAIPVTVRTDVDADTGAVTVRE